MKQALFSIMMVTLLLLSACASPTVASPTQLSSSDQIGTIVAATMRANPTNTPEPTCPEPVEGTKLLTREGMGYCLLYPEGYIEIGTFPTDVCLVPEGPTMGCHNMVMYISVEGAQGRTADQAADSLIAQGGYPPSEQRFSLTIAGENAVMLEPVHRQATERVVFIVHGDRLYTLGFIGPWGEDDNPELEQSERFYTQIIGSFAFVSAPPWVPSPTPITQQLFVPGDVKGTKFIAEASGAYRFMITSGAIRNCPPEVGYPDCGKWRAFLFVYVNRDAEWSSPSNSDSYSYGLVNKDFSIGNSIYRDTAAEAEAGSMGGSVTLSLQAGDFVWLLPPDAPDSYGDNLGGMTVSIAIIAPLP
jgi:hypothetical protein